MLHSSAPEHCTCHDPDRLGQACVCSPDCGGHQTYAMVHYRGEHWHSWCLLQRLAQVVERAGLLLDGVQTAKPAPHPDAPGCEGLSALWCPMHGDCTCPRPDEDDEDDDAIFDLDHPTCPLHGVD